MISLKGSALVLRIQVMYVEYIESGYHLPLKFIPPPHTQRYLHLVESHENFVDEAIGSLKIHYIVRVDV